MASMIVCVTMAAHPRYRARRGEQQAGARQQQQRGRQVPSSSWSPARRADHAEAAVAHAALRRRRSSQT
jgi:hypothetical protein